MHVFHQPLAEALHAERERELKERLRFAAYPKPKRTPRLKALLRPRLRRRAPAGVPTVAAG